jgi:hypothetical protein
VFLRNRYKNLQFFVVPTIKKIKYLYKKRASAVDIPKIFAYIILVEATEKVKLP